MVKHKRVRGRALAVVAGMTMALVVIPEAASVVQAAAPPTLEMSFSPTAVGPNVVSKLTFTISNTDEAADATGLAFNNELPSGLAIGTPANAGNTCGGTLTANAGTATITLAGGMLPAATFDPESGQVVPTVYAITADVTSATTGLYTNTATLSSSLGGNTASAAVYVAAGPPGFAKAFSPSTIGPGSTTTLSFTITNSDPVAPAEALAFTDTFPAGVTIAAAATATDTCSGTVSAPNGGSTISYTGGAVGASSSCTITVDVTSSTPLVHTNTSGNLTSTFGNSGSATADLTVDADLPGFSKSFSPATVDLGERSTLTFTIDNTSNASNVANLDFTDTLPNGMVIADPADASTDCGTATIPPTLTATPGTSTITLDANGTFGFPAVAAGGSCTVDVDVVATGAGELGNSSGELLADFSTSAGKANATLVATVSALHLTKEFTDDPVAPGASATLQFTITNYDRSEVASDVAFTDDLDAALAGLVAATLPTDPCGPGSVLTGTSTLQLSNGTVNPGEACSFDVVVTVPAAASGTATNTTGTVSGTAGGTAVTGNAASDDLFVVAAPVLAMDFTDDPVGAGSAVTLQYTITDTTSSGGSDDIAFSDELTAGAGAVGGTNGFLPFPISVALPADGFCGPGSSVSITSPGTDRQSLSVTGASLAAGASCTFDVLIDVPIGFAPGTYTNTSEPLSATVGGTTVSSHPASADIVVVGAPTLRKLFVDDPVAPGDTVTLEFTVANGGEGENDFDVTGPATDIAFTDDLSFTSGVTALGLPLVDPCGPASSLTGSAGDSFLTLTGGSLAEFESCVFSVVLQTSETTPVGFATNSTSDLSAIVLGTAVTGSGASDDLLVTDLSLGKEFTDDPVVAGELVTLDFTIANAGEADATSIQFSDDLSDTLSGLTFVSTSRDDCGGTLIPASGNTLLSYVGGTVLAGESCTLSVSLQVPAGAVADTYGNTTSPLSAVIGGTAVSLPAATDDLVVVDPPSVELAKEFTDDPVAPGADVTLRFSLSNPSATTITGIGFTDDLAATLSGLAVSSLGPDDCGGTLTGTTLLSYSGGTLAAGAACTIDAILTVPSEAGLGVYTNTTSGVTADNGVIGAPASDDLVVSEPQADLSVTKSGSDDTIVAESQLTYTITVTNDGPDPAVDVVVVDNLPPLDDEVPGGVTFGSTLGCDNDPNGLTCQLGDIPSGGSKSYTLTVDVLAGTLGTITNTATVSSATADPDLSRNTATEVTLVVANRPPTADANGPYVVAEGGTVLLDATGSSDPDEPSTGLTYEWAFDGDSVFDDATGATPTFSAAGLDGPSTVTVEVRVTDSEGASDTATAIVDVQNVAPSIGSLGITSPIDENGTATLSGTYSDIGTLDTHTIDIDWGDNTAIETVAVNAGSFSIDHQYLDDNPSGTPSDDYTVTVTVTDDDTGSDTDTTTVTVTNVAPVLSEVAITDVDENGTATLSGTYSDIGTLDTHTIDIDWGDNTAIETVAVNAGSFSIDHQYLDDNPSGTPSDDYTVTVTVTDDDTGSDTDTTTVTVTNVAPVLSEVAITDVDENGTATLSGTYSDIGTLDTHTIDIDWGDNTAIETVAVNAGSFSIDHQYLDDNPSGTPSDDYTVTVTVTDDDTGSDTDTTTVTVTNVAPVLSEVAITDVDENGTATLSGTYSDIGTLDTHTIDIDWGDNTAIETVAVNAGSFSIDHQYLDDNPSGTPSDDYTVTVTVTDDDTGSDTDTTTVTVTNVAPVVTASPTATTAQYSDGQPPITITATDVADEDLTASTEWSSDGVTFAAGLPRDLTLSGRSCTEDPVANTTVCIWTIDGTIDLANDTYTVRATVTDHDDAGTGTGTGTTDVVLTVEPEDATVAFDPDNPVAVQVTSDGSNAIDPFTLTVLVQETDPDVGFEPAAGDIDLAEVSVTLVPVGPGTPISPLEACTRTVTVEPDPYDSVLTVDCNFGDVPVNTYTVEVTVDGGYYDGSGEDVIVVFDPSLGFTTGGGTYIDGNGDRVNFGYTMKYNKKRTNVQGSLLVIRHTDEGVYRLKSNRIEGLAIGSDGGFEWASFTGKATYKEPDWADAIGNYEFIVYVEDHDTPGADADRFWVTANRNGELAAGLSMDSPATIKAATLTGGNIVVPHQGGGGGGRGKNTPLTESASPVAALQAAPSGTLPATGSGNTGPIALLALWSVVAGVGLFSLRQSKRRRSIS